VRWLVLFLVGCAQAGSPGQGTVDSNTGGGGSDGQQVVIDAPMQMIDAPPVGPMTRTLSQNNNQTLKAGNTIACGNVAAGTTAANNYYRVFDLPALGINSPFTVSKVSFQIEDCVALSGTGCTNVAVRVGTYNGTPGATLATASMNILASNASVTVPRVAENTTTTPPTTPGGTVDAPIAATIPAGSKLLVEVDAVNGTNTYRFYMGSNNGGETGFGYIMATDCGVTTPTNISSVSTTYPTVHLLLTVTGTY
jgi:hypothetical protein